MPTSRVASSLVAVLLACGPLACAAPETSADEPVGEDTQAAVGTSTPVVAIPDDTSTSVKVQNGMILTLNTELKWRGQDLVLHGSTSQHIDAVWGFIPDDAFGTVNQLGPQSFEIVYSSPSDINTILVGSRFYVQFTITSAAGTYNYAAALDVAPRLVPLSGDTMTTRLVLGTPITPVYVADNPNALHYRGTVTTSIAPQWITVTAASNPTLTQDAPHAWHFDWLFDGFVASARSTTPVEAKANFGASTSTRDDRIAARLSRVELAVTNSPDDTWGFPECDPAVAACIAALPAGTVDYGSCGAYIPVRTCLYQ